ncbi:cytochrome P450 [Fennellomyces sp. T-0311]|nr:cytochrome P450 [Fennellomyces sp. T-0311]
MPLIKSAIRILVNTFTTRSTFGSYIVLLGSISATLYIVYEKVLRPPPSLRHIPHLNFFTLFNALVMRKSINQFTKEVHAKDVVRSSISGLYLRRDNLGWSVRVTLPEDVKSFMSSGDLFQKSVGSRTNRKGTLAGRALIASNILYSVGDEWKRHRKIMNPAFHQAMPMKVFTTVSQQAIDIIETDKLTDWYNLSHRWALEVMGKTIFGCSLGTLVDDQSEWVVRFERIAHVVQNPVYFVIPFVERNLKSFIPELAKAHQEMTVYADMINEVVRQKRKAMMTQNLNDVENQEKDLLTLMIEASMQGNEHFSDEEFQANVFASFLVGHETTSATISFIFYYLAVNQEIQQRAREEAINVFGDGYDIHPTFHETQNLPYITMIIKETLRINPPITTFTDRVATEDTEIAGTFIPKGTHVGLTVYELHHNPKVWKNPDIFDPERFAPGGEIDQLDGLPWTPFGNGGARACTGMKSSMTQQRVFLSMLLRKYKWYLPEDSIHKNGVVTDGYVAMRPKNLQLTFQKRY